MSAVASLARRPTELLCAPPVHAAVTGGGMPHGARAALVNLLFDRRGPSEVDELLTLLARDPTTDGKLRQRIEPLLEAPVAEERAAARRAP